MFGPPCSQGEPTKQGPPGSGPSPHHSHIPTREIFKFVPFIFITVLILVLQSHVTIYYTELYYNSWIDYEDKIVLYFLERL